MSSKAVSFAECPKKTVANGNNKKKVFRRGKSLLGPLPDYTFGPKAVTRPDFTRDYAFDPENHRLTWSKPPESVLIIKRTGTETDSAFKSLSSWLIEAKKMHVYVEPKIIASEHMKKDEDFKTILSQLKPYHKQTDFSFKVNNVDLIITIGGDGTLLYAASMFQHSMPPVIAFSMGSLGFLTAHPLKTYKETVNSVLDGNAMLMLRSRMRCKIERQSAMNEGLKPNDSFENFGKVFQGTNETEDEDSRTSFLVLNEVVVNRGTSQYLCNLDLYLEGRQITSVQGDGLIISTPTGSTAYAVAAGASMVHPDVPSILIAPICPHSLSFRPIIVPAGVELKFSVSKNARGSAWVSFDGSSSKEIKQGDIVTIRTSIHPTPCVCRNNPFDDWFDSLSTCLHWNSRENQKALGSGDV